MLADGREAIVEGIDGPAGEQQTATRGESVSLRLDRDIDLSRGDVIAADDLPEPQQSFTATVFHLSETPVRLRGNVLVRYGTALVRGRVDEVIRRVDISGRNRSDEEIAHGSADELALNDIAEVRVTVAEPLPVETYRRGGRVGSLLLVNPGSGDTLTAGLVN